MNATRHTFHFSILIFLMVSGSCCFSQTGEKLSLDNGWRFHLGDIPMPEIKGHSMTYGSAKAGKAFGAAAPDYNDSQWRSLSLPHDWSVELPMDFNNNISQGFRTRGFGWYRRNFKLPVTDKGKYLELQFDGIATHCTVWVNGTIVHRNWCGYTSSYIDITPFAKYGEEINSIAVRVDATAQEGWWYEGAGIYRHTWLVKRNAVHISTDGVFAQPVRRPDRSWILPVQVNLVNSGQSDRLVQLEVSLLDSSGRLVAFQQLPASIAALQQRLATTSLPVTNPMLWSIEAPVLYTVKTVIKESGNPLDASVTGCGFRTILFTADSGFYLNDKYVKLKGVCNHQDAAGVGVAVPDAIWEYRIRKLKEMGANAYRCAHNPPAVEFLDACDRLGILVMDENRNFNSSPEYMRQLQWLIQRDRNHPSVILWSVFNEEPMQGTAAGYEMVRRMRAEVKKYDSTRPVTAAMSGGQFAPVNVSQTVDVVGFNYVMEDYDRFHKENPDLPLTSSEDVSAFMMRGEYANDYTSKHIIGSYDTEKASWGMTHRSAWKMVAERKFVAGCFVWTGFDYRGEPSPFTSATPDACFGIMDQCGFPKTAFWLHQAQWRDDIQALHLVPHWTWPADSIGKKIKVMVLSNADSVQVFLNGKAVGGQRADKYEMNTWQIPYQPGRLKAVGYKNGKQVSSFVEETTGSPVAIQLIPDRQYLTNDGRDAMPVTVQVLDAKGRPVPTSDAQISFEVTGGGTNIGVANGNSNSLEMEKANSRKLYNGMAQLIVQSVAGSKDRLIITARSEGLKPAVAIVELKSVAAIAAVPVETGNQ